MRNRRCQPSGLGERRRRRILVILILVQIIYSSLLASEFLTYYLIGYNRIPWQLIEIFEISEVVFAVLSIAIGLTVVYLLINRNARVESQLKAASGAFEELLREKFSGWNLTPSELDVALFIVKGMTIAEIAQLRGTSEGTVKAQSNAVYRKAGVNSRSQLLGLFIEELFGESIIGGRAGVEP